MLYFPVESIEIGRFVQSNKAMHMQWTLNAMIRLLHNIIDIYIE